MGIRGPQIAEITDPYGFDICRRQRVFCATTMKATITDSDMQRHPSRADYSLHGRMTPNNRYSGDAQFGFHCGGVAHASVDGDEGAYICNGIVEPLDKNQGDTPHLSFSVVLSSDFGSHGGSKHTVKKVICSQFVGME